MRHKIHKQNLVLYCYLSDKWQRLTSGACALAQHYGRDENIMDSNLRGMRVEIQKNKINEIGNRGLSLTLAFQFQRNKIFLPCSLEMFQYCGNLRNREVACSASDRQGSNFESSIWRAVSSHSSHHPREAHFRIIYVQTIPIHFIFFNFDHWIWIFRYPSCWLTIGRVSTRRWSYVGVILEQRLRLWPALNQHRLKVSYFLGFWSMIRTCYQKTITNLRCTDQIMLE